jgi:hypothetical protein
MYSKGKERREKWEKRGGRKGEEEGIEERNFLFEFGF